MPYLQFNGAFCGATDEPLKYLDVEMIETDYTTRRHSATGYGRRMATDYMVRYNGRWRRVYACCYGNAATHYIGNSANPIATVHT